MVEANGPTSPWDRPMSSGIKRWLQQRRWRSCWTMSPRCRRGLATWRSLHGAFAVTSDSSGPSCRREPQHYAARSSSLRQASPTGTCRAGFIWSSWPRPLRHSLRPYKLTELSPRSPCGDGVGGGPSSMCCAARSSLSPSPSWLWPRRCPGHDRHRGNSDRGSSRPDGLSDSPRWPSNRPGRSPGRGLRVGAEPISPAHVTTESLPHLPFPAAAAAPMPSPGSRGLRRSTR